MKTPRGERGREAPLTNDTTIKNILTHASVFSGIGGAELAASWMGWKNLFHCEIQQFPRQVLDYWFPNSESYEDITKTTFTKWKGKVDVLTGGFPCQPFSYAGSRKGAEDDRYLWPEMLRAIREIQPTWALLKTLLASRRWYNPAVSLKWDVQTFSSKKVLYVEKNTGTSSMPSVKTLSEKDMKSNRLLFQLVPQERPIEETGYGLLPTVQTQGLKRCNKKGKTEFLPLHLLPTPTAAEATKYTTKLNSKSQMGMGLTALAMNGKLPSPKKAAEETGGSQGSRQFNPLYAEEVMGFPSMWTTLPFLKENGERNP